jgi:cob(I)alamin adenosyltransferase
MKIYTKTGDAGETSLFDNTRVIKSDPRVDAYGEVDEMNACLGVARAAGVPEDIGPLLLTIQQKLFALGARLADPSARISARVNKATITDNDVAFLEQSVDRLEDELSPLRAFILPGGTPAGAALHLARTVCRRAERRVVTLEGVESVVLIYLNRLSDLLFVIARVVNHRQGIPETEW